MKHNKKLKLILCIGILVFTFNTVSVLKGSNFLNQEIITTHPSVNLDTPILVIPFSVKPTTENAIQWLGRAISFYMTKGLKMNGFQVLPDHLTSTLLEINHINFPYLVSKASIINIAKHYQFKYLIWGEISVENESFLQLRTFIINLDQLSQKHLPLVKGKLNDLYNIKNELLGTIVKSLFSIQNRDSTHQALQDILYPQLDLNHRNYEFFIKSRLIKNVPKKIQLLMEITKEHPEIKSDVLFFELASLHFFKGEFDIAEEMLAKMSDIENSPQPPPQTSDTQTIREEKKAETTPNSSQKLDIKNDNLHWVKPSLSNQRIYLKGLIACARENWREAKDLFYLLQNEKSIVFEVLHNLGVIHFKLMSLNSAQIYFKRALNFRKDPDTCMNLIQVLMALDKNLQAEKQLKQALYLFPQEEQFIPILSYFLSQSEEKQLLFSLFQNYIPNLSNIETPPEISLKLKNPFQDGYFQSCFSAIKINSSEKSLISPIEDLDGAIENVQELLAINPFNPFYHRTIAAYYLKKKEYHQAKLHALALVFLEKTKENYLLLVKILKKSGDKQKAKEIQRAMTEKIAD